MDWELKDTLDQNLISFLCEETTFEDIGNENLLHEFPAFGEMVGQAINSDTLLQVSSELSDLLEEMDLYKACLLAYFIGFACEKEEDVSAGRGVVTLFLKACSNVYEMMKCYEREEECNIPADFSVVYKQNREWVKAYYGFEILCISAMAFLTRDSSLRDLLQDEDIGEQIRYLTEETPQSPYLKSVYYVNRIRVTCADFPLLILQPHRRQGFLAAANDLDNCFHLIFLLEEQIAEKLGTRYGMEGFRRDETLTRLAYGEYPENYRDKHYSTYFMECNYDAVSRGADITRLIWGEMPPECIPCIEGRGIIVLADTKINRSFDPAFLAVCHSALNPYVRIERELSEEEYEMWVEKIRTYSKQDIQ